MNQASNSIGKQNINLTWLDNRRYFTFAKCRVNHRLTAAISARSIIRCAGFSRSATRSTTLVWDARATFRTTHPRDLSFFSYGSDDVTALFAASDAHLFDSISDRKNFFLVHITPSWEVRLFENFDSPIPFQLGTIVCRMATVTVANESATGPITVYLRLLLAFW